VIIMLEQKEKADPQVHAHAVHPEHKVAIPERKNPLMLIKEHPLVADAVVIIVILALAGGFLVWHDMSAKIYIEKAEISAPVISLAPLSSGQIDKFYVEEGDQVSQGQKLAKVGDEIITAKTAGIIIWIKDSPGELVGPAVPVVKMVDPREFRLVGRIAEDKGLSDIKEGQKVVFTVDAFPSKQYQAIVDSVGAAARQSDIMFSISDKREEREFEIKALFDTNAYSELKNGMSAKMWIYK